MEAFHLLQEAVRMICDLSIAQVTLFHFLSLDVFNQSAAAISHMLKDWSGFNKDKAVKYILSSQV